MQIDLSPGDEDSRWLFERTVTELQKTHGHTEEAAIALVNAYYKRFSDSDFCSRFDLSPQTSEFFLREESLNMADRIQFFEHLSHAPIEDNEFTQWQRKFRLKGAA